MQIILILIGANEFWERMKYNIQNKYRETKSLVWTNYVT